MRLGLILAQIGFVLEIPKIMGEPWFKYLLLPVVGLLAGAAVKSFYRSDQQEWAKEDFAWGPDLMTSSCLMMLLLAADRSAQHIAMVQSSSPDRLALINSIASIASPIVVFIVNLVLLALLTIWIRRKGWENPDHLYLLRGFIVPWLVGLLCVGASFYLGVM